MFIVAMHVHIMKICQILQIPMVWYVSDLLSMVGYVCIVEWRNVYIYVCMNEHALFNTMRGWMVVNYTLSE